VARDQLKSISVSSVYAHPPRGIEDPNPSFFLPKSHRHVRNAVIGHQGGVDPRLAARITAVTSSVFTRRQRGHALRILTDFQLCPYSYAKIHI